MTYDLGIVTRVTPRVSRRSLLGAMAALAAFSHIAPALAQTATPASQAEGDADALEVLKAAGERVMDLETFTFSLETIAGSSTILPSVELISVHGAVRRPTDLTATLRVKAFIQELEISAVVLDGAVYVQNPLSGGAWQNMGEAPQIATMINPDWLVLAAINVVKDARITDRGDLTLIEGYVDLAGSLASLESQDMAQVQDFLADTPVDVAFWIDQDGVLTRAELYGPIFASESADVEKRIEFSNFDEPVEIEAPAI